VDLFRLKCCTEATGKYTTDLDSSTRLKSVTQEGDLDEFLNTAQLAGADFTAGISFAPFAVPHF
jgi:hypothetical protein